MAQHCHFNRQVSVYPWFNPAHWDRKDGRCLLHHLQHHPNHNTVFSPQLLKAILAQYGAQATNRLNALHDLDHNLLSFLNEWAPAASWRMWQAPARARTPQERKAALAGLRQHLSEVHGVPAAVFLLLPSATDLARLHYAVCQFE